MRLGALHRSAPAAVPLLANRARLDLMQAPAACDWHAAAPADGDDLGNKTYGCCVEAADFQLIRLRRANAWNDTWKPTEGDVLDRYTALTGFNPLTGQPDDGTLTDEDMKAWCSQGIRLDSQNLDVPKWCTIEPHEIEHVNLGIAHMGAVLITLDLPMGAQSLAWDKAPGQGADWVAGSWGQHRVISGKYDGASRTVRTWGQDLLMHPDFWQAYVLAVDVVLSRDWLRASGLAPAQLDYAQLDWDMAKLTA